MTNASQLSLFDLGPSDVNLDAIRAENHREKAAAERYERDANADEARDLDA